MYKSTDHMKPQLSTNRRHKSRPIQIASKTLSELIAHPTNVPANPTLFDIPHASITSTAHSFHKSTQPDRDPPSWQLHSTAVRFPEQRVDDIWMVPAQDVYETVFVGGKGEVVETVWTLEDRCVVRLRTRMGNDVRDEMVWNHPIDPLFWGKGLLQMCEERGREGTEGKNDTNGGILTSNGANGDGKETPAIARSDSEVTVRPQNEEEEAMIDFRCHTPDVHEGIVYDLLYPCQPTAQFTPAPIISFPQSSTTNSATTEGDDHHLTLWERRKRRQDCFSDAASTGSPPEVVKGDVLTAWE